MELFEKIKDGGRISASEALEIWNGGFYALARCARARVESLGLGDGVGYIVNRMINYSNICRARCKFCAYHAKAGVIDAFRLSDDEILKIVEDSVSCGAVQIMLQGGLHPDFDLDWACSILRKISSAYPKLALHAFSPSEVICFADGAGVPVIEALRRLKDSGLTSLPGAADLLVEDIRKNYCPLKCSVSRWREVMLSLASLGMRSSATMTFGMGETLAQRLEHLEFVRSVQDECGVFDAFIAWPLAPENTELKDIPRLGAAEFLMTLALSRAFLDNIRNVQSGWLTEGLDIAQLALNMGANDVGGVLMDEMVVRAAGIDNKTGSSGMEECIRRAGKVPFRRDNFYRRIS